MNINDFLSKFYQAMFDSQTCSYNMIRDTNNMFKHVQMCLIMTHDLIFAMSPSHMHSITVSVYLRIW